MNERNLLLMIQCVAPERCNSCIYVRCAHPLLYSLQTLPLLLARKNISREGFERWNNGVMAVQYVRFGDTHRTVREVGDI